MRNWQKKENVYLLDVRIHHRIWVVQKHLLLTLIKMSEMLIENNSKGVPVQ